MTSQGTMLPKGQTPGGDLSSTMLGSLFPEQWDSRGEGCGGRLLAKSFQQQLSVSTGAIESELQLSPGLDHGWDGRTCYYQMPCKIK